MDFSPIPQILRALRPFLLERPQEIESKEGHANFVTSSDLHVQAEIFRQLQELYPSAACVGEEDEEGQQLPLPGACFLLDPIDGTSNFIFDLHCSAISLAYCEGGRPLAAWVYNPYLDQLYEAHKGRGAQCNGQPLKSRQGGLSQGLCCADLGSYIPESRREASRFADLIADHCLGLRILGCASLGLCMVAAGQLQAYYGKRLQAWDYAAAELIIEEAGGLLVAADGQPLGQRGNLEVLAAANSESLAALQALHHQFYTSAP